MFSDHLILQSNYEKVASQVYLEYWQIIAIQTPHHHQKLRPGYLKGLWAFPSTYPVLLDFDGTLGLPIHLYRIVLMELEICISILHPRTD